MCVASTRVFNVQLFVLLVRSGCLVVPVAVVTKACVPVYLEMRRVCYYSPLCARGLASVAGPLVPNGRDVGF